jgi:hypothetical protein
MAVRISALATAAYVLAFWSGNFQARALFGVAMLAVIYFWWWFVVSPGFKDGFASYDDVKLMIAFGLTTLVLGSTLGVIVQVILGTGNAIPSSADLIGGHASAQTGGYLVLVAAESSSGSCGAEAAARASVSRRSDCSSSVVSCSRSACCSGRSSVRRSRRPYPGSRRCSHSSARSLSRCATDAR